MINAVVVTSGDGIEFQSLLDSIFFGEIPNFRLAAVVSSRENAFALTRAKKSGVAAYTVSEELFPNGASFSLALLNKLRDLDADLVIAAGFAPKLSSSIARAYSGRVIALRAAIYPAFEGMSGREACAEAVRRGVKLSGATAYFADGEGGVGRVIGQCAVEVLPGDDGEALYRRIIGENGGELLVEAVKEFCAGAEK